MERRGARTAAATAVLAALLTTALPSSTGSARTLEAKPGSIDALKAEVRASSERLARAVERYQLGQVELGGLLNTKVSTQKQLEALQKAAAAAQERARALAGTLYRNPVDPTLRAMLDGNVRAVVDLRHLQRQDQVTADDQRKDADLLSGYVADGARLLQSQDDAATRAIALQARLDDELQQLRADTVATSRRLAAALADLRRRQAAAAAAALGSGGGASCQTDVPADAVNGFLPIAALCPLQTAPGHRLSRPAARAFDQMARAFQAAQGQRLCVTDSYRDYAGQVSVFARKPQLAATPGKSLHGWGIAVDLCGGVQQFGSPAFVWMQENAPLFGFHHPDWAEPDGSKPEPWHWEFRA